MKTIPNDPERFVVITGAPGAGKSTLIDALEDQGFARSLEAGRAIIQDQVAIDGPAVPWSDPAAFAELMLSWEMRSWRNAQTQEGLVFFDRGIPDLVGYFPLMNLPVPSHVHRAAETFRYNRRVFIAPFWAEIFRQDAERKQTPEEAERTCHAIAEAWPRYGYDLVFLPLTSVEERVGFVLEQIKR